MPDELGKLLMNKNNNIGPKMDPKMAAKVEQELLTDKNWNLIDR